MITRTRVATEEGHPTRTVAFGRVMQPKCTDLTGRERGELILNPNLTFLLLSKTLQVLPIG